MLQNAPVQARSRETLERIVEAAAALLQVRPFEQVSIREITQRAGCPTGSFYARFKSKDDLLPYLYERYDQTIGERVSRSLAEVPWRELDLREACTRGIELMVDMYVERRWLLREMALFARRYPNAIPPEMVARRSGIHGRPVELLLARRDEIAHPNPERAVEVALYVAAAAARDAILFADAPHAAVTRLSPDALKATLSQSLYHFLTQPCPPPHACCSPPPARRSVSPPKRGSRGR